MWMGKVKKNQKKKDSVQFCLYMRLDKTHRQFGANELNEFIGLRTEFTFIWHCESNSRFSRAQQRDRQFWIRFQEVYFVVLWLIYFVPCVDRSIVDTMSALLDWDSNGERTK